VTARLELPEKRAVISGIGQSAVGRPLARSGFQLTIDAIQAAVEDAGLRMTDIDGIATYPGPVPEYIPGFVGPDLYSVQDALGLDVGWHLATPQGASPIAPLIHAVLAVAAGLCRHAVIYRTITEASGQAGQGRAAVGAGIPAEGHYEFLLPVGAVSGANWAALFATCHMHRYGTVKEQLGWVAIAARAHAGRNPAAVYSKPLSMDEYLSARVISTPLSLYDCDVPVDGSTAVIVSSADTVPDLRHPVRIEAMGGALRHRPRWEQWDDLTTMAAHDAAAQLWGRTDLGPRDVDVAQLYDGFSIYTLMWLEAFGFCGPGESGKFVEGGGRLQLDGELPLNTAGGQLSGGRLHGWGLVAEAVRQLRGEAAARQVANARVAAVGVGGGVVCGALLLTAI
jgi:acetyl-CoA acetyltransferase